MVLYYPDGRWGYRPGAYDGWISDPGHGVFTKRSFLAPYANTAEAAEPEAEPVAEEAEAEAPAEAELEAPGSELAPAEEAALTAQPDDADTSPAAPEPAPTADDGSGLSGGAVAAIVVVVLAAIGALGYGLARRRGRADTVED